MNLAFRIGGRIIERKGEVGDKVEPDQVLAKLDPQDELNTLRSAQAALNAARGQNIEAQNTFDRQNHLMERGFTTRVNFDPAKQACKQRRRGSTMRPRSSTSPKTGSASPNSRPGRGNDHRPIRRVGRGDAGGPADLHHRADRRAGRGVRRPAQVLRAAPADATITIALANDPR